MSDQKRDEYEAKDKALREARAKVEDLVKLVVDGATKLKQDWRKVEIHSIGIGTGHIATQRPLIDGRLWPTAQDLAKALLAYHNALGEAERVYNQLRAAGYEKITPPDA